MRSDEVPALVGHGTTDVEVGVFSLSARSPDAHDARYLAWHALDHLPEQHRIAGVRAGTRWVSTPACRAARTVPASRYDAVDHVVNYLFGPPVADSLRNFFLLGAALRTASRMPLRLPAVELGAYELTSHTAAAATAVGSDVLPWRPHTGILLLIEAGMAIAPDELAAVSGVAGCWSYRGTDASDRFAPTSGQQLTVCYLDADPVETAARLAPVLTRRWDAHRIEPLLAAPFVTVVPWAWDRALPWGAPVTARPRPRPSPPAARGSARARGGRGGG